LTRNEFKKVVKGIFRYLKGIEDIGLVFNNDS